MSSGQLTKQCCVVIFWYRGEFLHSNKLLLLNTFQYRVICQQCSIHFKYLVHKSIVNFMNLKGRPLIHFKLLVLKSIAYFMNWRGRPLTHSKHLVLKYIADFMNLKERHLIHARWVHLTIYAEKMYTLHTNEQSHMK